MATESDLIRLAFSKAQSGWQRYFITLFTISISLFIDILTGAQFFISDEVDIQFLNYEIPRIAFSFTYSIVFGTFVVWALVTTGRIRHLIETASAPGVAKELRTSAEYRLWGLSPVNPSRPIRIVFWSCVVVGALILAAVSVIHLFGINMPDEKLMRPLIYRGIGIVAAIVFGFSTFALIRHVYPDWEYALKWLEDGRTVEQ